MYSKNGNDTMATKSLLGSDSTTQPAPKTKSRTRNGSKRTHASHDDEDSRKSDSFRATEISGPRYTLAAVEIPVISDTEDYEFLPGHFSVRSIISETLDADQELEPIFRVELESGEIETIPYHRLQTLNAAEQALEQFRAYGGYPGHDSPSPSGQEEYASSSSEDSQSRRARSSNGTRGQLTSFVDDGDDNDGRSEDSQNRRTRSSNKKGAQPAPFHDDGDDDDESSDEEISSEDELVSSSVARRRLRTRKASPQSKAARHSTRPRNVVRHNLRERLEDDELSEREIPERKKFFGAKEIFKTIPRDDRFRSHHRDICEVCVVHGDDAERGPLVFCQGCTNSYHQACLGSRAQRSHLVTKIGDDNFILQCRFCLGIANAKDRLCPHQGCCAQCGELGKMSKPLREHTTPRREQQLRQENGGNDPITPVDMSQINEVQNLLFRCTRCHRGFHFEHLPPQADELFIPKDLTRARFEEYSPTWQCHNCISALGDIDSLVAWRPSNSRVIPPDSTASSLKEEDKDYLVTWKGKSYYQAAWMPGTWVWGASAATTRKAFFRSPKNWTPCSTKKEAIPEEFLRVDIVFDVRYSEGYDDRDDVDRTFEEGISRVHDVREAFVKYKGLPYENAVWEKPPDENDTGRWKDFKAAYADWVWRDYVHVPDQSNLRRHLAQVRKQNFNSIVLDKQPENMTGGQIMDYQKDGMNWLYYMWFKQKNAILADEMGLGKTIQVIGFFSALISYHKCWPFLVIAPNAACPNWRREIKAWAPSIRVVTYYGSQLSRKLSFEHEMFSAEGKGSLACHVVVASYETMIDEGSRRILSRIPWAALVVDEGQRLKNDKSQTYSSLSRMNIPFEVLLTGTPLQNNIRELLNLLQFCDPTKDAEALEEEYGALSKADIAELHAMIRPSFLRRTKAQVLDFLPPLTQIIVPVSMSVVQKKLYKSILAKNPQLIKAIFESGHVKRGERHNLNNILLQLRKCLCHPFVYSRAIEERTPNIDASHQHLLEASGKLQLLALMLPKLKERGHRVLIFSQFLENLDIVEDFLDGLGLIYRRLDGRMSSLEKQKQIDEFNAKNSPTFAFLLSTRSGGVGINLASADTVIIMDPDFNPHQDLQALSRAHRIGQKNKVLVFQLMTRASVEERIMQIGKKKMALDHVLIEKVDEDDVPDLESILRHGAQALFEDDDSEDVHYDNESVEKLLDRSQVEQDRPSDDAPASQFSFARVWTNDNSLEDKLQDTDNGPTPPNSTVWEKILQERERAATEEARMRSEALGRGKRKRNAVNYTATEVQELPEKPKSKKKKKKEDEDAAFVAAEEPSDSDAEDPGVVPEELSDDLAEDLAGIAPELKKGRPSNHAGVPPAAVNEIRPFDAVPQAVGAGPSNVGAPSTIHNVPPSNVAGAPPPAVNNVNGIDRERQSSFAAPCVACDGHHPVGSCRLKSVGVQRCGLCGIAHFGMDRSCPKLRSEDELLKMHAALELSNEPRELVDSARKYLDDIRDELALKKLRPDEKSSWLSYLQQPQQPQQQQQPQRPQQSQQPQQPQQPQRPQKPQQSQQQQSKQQQKRIKQLQRQLELVQQRREQLRRQMQQTEAEAVSVNSTIVAANQSEPPQQPQQLQLQQQQQQQYENQQTHQRLDSELLRQGQQLRYHMHQAGALIGGASPTTTTANQFGAPGLQQPQPQQQRIISPQELLGALQKQQQLSRQHENQAKPQAVGTGNPTPGESLQRPPVSDAGGASSTSDYNQQRPPEVPGQNGQQASAAAVGKDPYIHYI